MELFFSLFSVGIITGIASSILGVGGGVIMIPLFGVIFSEIPQQFLIASSLTVILFNSGANVWNFTRKHISIDWNLVWWIAGAALVSGFFAAKVGINLPPKTLKIIFISFITFLVLPLKIAALYNKKIIPESHIPQHVSAIIIGIISGGISGLTGVGGGVIIVPLLVTMLHLDFKKTSAYSNALMIFTSSSAVIGYGSVDGIILKDFWNIGYILPLVVAMVLCGSLIGSRLGVKFHKGLKPKTLKKVFIVLMIIVIIKSFISLIG